MGMTEYYEAKDAEPDQVHPLRRPDPLDALAAQSRALLKPMLRLMLSMSEGAGNEYTRGQRDLIRTLLGVSEDDIRQEIEWIRRRERRR